MTNDEQQNKVLFDIKDDLGYLRGKIEGIDKHMTEQNGTIKDLVKSSKRHDIALGKIGMLFTGAIVVIDIGIKAAIGFFKNN